MDTANDLRIKLAEKGLKELEKLIQNVKVQKRKELLNRIRNANSLMQTVKYSYMPPEELKELEEFKKLVSEAKTVREAIKSAEKDFNCIQADYWLEYIESLPMLMDRGEIDSPCLAVRFFAGDITSRSEIGGKLWLCIVDCNFRLEVVTNSQEFSPGKRAVIVYLPPRKFGNYISRGMFVSIADEEKGEVKDIEVLKKYCSGDVSAAVLSLVE